jgi:hypothetical protein
MKYFNKYFRQLSVFLIVGSLLSFIGCGKDDGSVPKEETGEPNTLPSEVLHFREARDTFLKWTEAFAPDRNLTQAYALLNASSRKALRQQGVVDAGGFESWFEQQTAANRTPFSYTFSRFDILDIDLQDSTRAIVTATFLVHLHQSTFESVGSFILRRERGRWVIPFVQGSSFEAGWWEKEKQFAMRMSEEGMTRFTSTGLSLSLKYPVAWDVLSKDAARIPTQASVLKGVALQYIDPASLTPVAFARVAILPGPLPDSLQVSGDSSFTAQLRFLRSEKVTNDNGLPVEGEVRWIADPSLNRYILFYSAVDVSLVSYDRFVETFAIIRKSLLPSTEVLP